MRSLRLSTPYTVFPHDKAASSDIRTGYIDGRPVKRLVVTLRAPGCSWVERSGGCTMCGHYAGTTRGELPTADDYFLQFQREISQYNLNEISVISIYNSGSVLNPGEFGIDALKKIFRHIHNFPSIRKVVLETRAEYVNAGMLDELLNCLGPERTLTIAIGLETADDTKRQLCINKGCTTVDIERAVGALKGRAEIQLYVLLGLPFLTETEALEDAVKTIGCAHDMGADEIHLEPLTLQRFTLTDMLYRNGLLRLPSLYTLYEVLRSVVPAIRPYVSPFLHMPSPDMIPQGCPSCTNRLVDGLLKKYNINRDRFSLDYEDCACINGWRELLAETDSRPLTQRVNEAIIELRSVEEETSLQCSKNVSIFRVESQ